MELDVVVDEVGAEETEEFVGTVVAAVGDAIEFYTLAGEVLTVVIRGDKHRAGGLELGVEFAGGHGESAVGRRAMVSVLGWRMPERDGMERRC